METNIRNKCKAYTSLEQSKKLAEILPLESADMYYIYDIPYAIPYKNRIDVAKPCWSLSALLNLLPNINDKQPILTKGRLTGLWYCYYEDEIDTQTYDNPIDAVFEMICLLKENNKI